MKILVTGAGGQLGQDLSAAFADHEVLGLAHAQLDVGDRDAVLAAVTGFSPDAVVHAGAWTAVDACESDPDRAFRTNALGTRFVAEACRLVDARLCYVSTDYVFDGSKAEPYVEWDTPHPLSVYGRSKLGGELEVDPTSLIVRTSWVCGFGGSNMVRTILRLADEHDTLSFVDDQRGQPTFTPDLARIIQVLVTRRLSGRFHVTNQGAVSWYEFAQEVLAASGADPDRVAPITTADMPRPAPRPANSVLDNAALRLSALPLAPDFRDPLQQLVDRIRSS